MANNRNIINEMVEHLHSSGKLDDIVKEASENVTDEATEEVVEETKEAETAEEAEATEEVVDDGIDYDKIAELVAQKISNEVPTEGTDKVASLVEELNKEAEELGASQEMIVTALYNGYFSDEVVDASDIVKMANEEDSLVPYVVDSLYKYATAADATLYEKYEEDYNEDDVIKMAAVIIESTEDPFGFEAMQAELDAEQEKEAEEADPVEALADEFATRLREKLAE